MGMVVNQAELAQIMGVSKQTISAWQEEGLPVATRGVRGRPNSYDTAKVVKWFAARESGKSEETQKDRLSRVQADRIEMEMAHQRGELVPAAEIAPAWSGIVIAVRQALLAIPAGVAPLLAQADGQDEIRTLLEEAIADALTKLSATDERGIGEVDPVDAGAVRAAAEDPAVRVGRRKAPSPAG